jgi:hypothetical protein
MRTENSSEKPDTIFIIELYGHEDSVVTGFSYDLKSAREEANRTLISSIKSKSTLFGVTLLEVGPKGVRIVFDQIENREATGFTSQTRYSSWLSLKSLLKRRKMP